jgi:hypothetical protein
MGNYRLERLIGRGRMGVVYLAKDEALLRPTAVKVLSWDAEETKGHDPVQWFLAEARLVARINDPQVVQVYGAARHGGLCYIAMEYVAGRSADDLLAAAGRLAPELATGILVQAAAALQAAHGSDVVHRDVKPANLLVGASGITKLGDFGLAHGAGGRQVGHHGVQAGTPLYTAPEIWRGGAAGPASDLYSLGATYYHLLTGRAPFQAAEVAEVAKAHLSADIPDPRALVPGLPPSCAALVRRAMCKRPAERYTSAQELLWDARRVLADLSSAQGTASAPSVRGADGPLTRGPMTPARRCGTLVETWPPAGAGPGTSPLRGEPVRPARRRHQPAVSSANSAADLRRIAGLRGVTRVVLGDLDGAYLEGIEEPAGEASAAVMGHVSRRLLEAGEALGLGQLGSIAVTGPAQASLVLVRDQSVIAARVEPADALQAVEKALRAASPLPN